MNVRNGIIPFCKADPRKYIAAVLVSEMDEEYRWTTVHNRQWGENGIETCILQSECNNITCNNLNAIE